jgi:hypothetical protein
MRSAWGCASDPAPHPSGRLQHLRRGDEARDVDGEPWWRTLVETAAVVPCFAAFLWACYAVLNALLVVTADDFPQCARW